MSVFDDVKSALEIDISWDIKFRIEADYFDVILKDRKDEDWNNRWNGKSDIVNELSSLTIRYNTVIDEVYLLLGKRHENYTMSLTTIHTISKIMNVLYNNKSNIDELCALLSGADRENNMRKMDLERTASMKKDLFNLDDDTIKYTI